MRILFLTLLGLLLFFGALMPKQQQEVQAFDPVTIAILTPVAIQVAKEMRPYVMAGLGSGIRHMVNMGKDIFELFYLPLGVIQVTIGVPFGGLSYGVRNIGKGIVAPFKIALKAVLLPIAFMGVTF